MSLRDEILRANEIKETAVKDAMKRKQNEMKFNYRAEIQKASADITDCIFSAFRTARVSDSYQIPGILFNETVYRKNIAIEMRLNVRFHEQFQESIVFKGKYFTIDDDTTYFDGYTLYADVYSYPRIMNAVIDKLEKEGIAEGSAKELGGSPQNGFRYITVISEFSPKWKRINPEFVRRNFKSNSTIAITLAMVLCFS